MMEQATLDYDDMFAGLNSQILKNIYIRFYTMQDYFQFPNQPKQSHSKIQSQPQPQTQPQKKYTPIYMMYNRIIQQSIYDLYIMNKLINSKAKLVHSILDNGQSIAAKKNDSWIKFIQRDCFGKIKLAYQGMPDFKKDLVKFAVLSISNLLLKLSINMSKVSVIPIQKFLNFQCLNIPTLSVAFLLNLQYILFNSKNITQPTQKLNFMRQLPKITYIKLNHKKNNTDLQTLQTSQYQFISSKVDQPVKNLQYIQLYQQQYDPIMPKYEQKTKYIHIHRFNLGKIGGNRFKSPYNFQILEIMRQIVFPLVKEFKPDQIVYMESYSNQCVVMNDQVRGLMLCQMAEQTTCNKMYVFKELGLDKYSLQAYKQHLITNNQQKITQQLQTIFIEEQKRIGKAYNRKQLMKPQDKNAINKIKRIFTNQLCYISLALIQRTSFDEVREKSNKEIIDLKLLEGIQRQLIELSQNKQIQINFKTKIQGIRMMKNFSQLKQNKSNNQNSYKIINLITKSTHFNTYFNIQKQCSQQLLAISETEQKQIEFTYSQEDNCIVKYYQKKVVVIIIKYNQIKDQVQMIFLGKGFEDKFFKILGMMYCDPLESYLEGATYICSNDYLYRGFGKHKRTKENDSQTFNKKIHRIRIDPQVKTWQLVATQAIAAKPGDKQQSKIQLQKKIYGYGIYDIDNKSILMMGGYVDSYNEERISKNIYYIKNCQLENINKTNKVTNDSTSVSILSKTNKILYTTQKLKDLFLYPFVFGIPFFVGKSSYVLNSNGNYMNLNHFGKIFMSLVKLSPITVYNGISVQNKLYISNDPEQVAISIFFAELLQKCLIFYPHQINMKDNICCVQTLEEGPIVIKADVGSKVLEIKAVQVFEDEQWRKIKFF